jgi:hypothetical protein
MSKITIGTCVVDGCGKTGRVCRDMCVKHYERWRRHGDTSVVLPRGAQPRIEPELCSIPGCGKPHVARGWCARHYDSWRRYGDPLTVHRIFGDHEARLWSQVNKDAPVPDYRPDLGPCWVWTGPLDSRGYGNMNIKGRGPIAHRHAYEFAVGPIPEGLEIDHLCRVRACVNPAHLEPVTSAENMRRAADAKFAARGNVCINGHEYTPDNTYVNPRGGRQCRICMRDYAKRYQARKKSATREAA